MKVIVSHPTGNTYVRANIKSLCDSDALACYYTTVALGKGISGKFISKLPERIASRRKYDLPSELIKINPLRELVRQLAIEFKQDWLTKREVGWACLDKVFKTQDDKVAEFIKKNSNLIDAVYAHEDGALSTFQTARSLGLKCLYDQPIPYWRAGHRIFKEEMELKPEWRSTLGSLKDSAVKLKRKDDEIRLANAIFCASSFSKESFSDFPGALEAEIKVVPYGAPPVNSNPKHTTSKGNALKVLFVGGLSQRKGLSYLFDSVNALGGKVDLTVVGRVYEGGCKALTKELQSCRYIESLSRKEILKEMELTDVFVFPSLFEGFGLVLLEAMSQGTPCITTAHTGGADFITHGVDGFIVPIRDSQSISEILENLYADRDWLASIQQNAKTTAAKLSWTTYEQDLISSIREVIS